MQPHQSRPIQVTTLPIAEHEQIICPCCHKPMRLSAMAYTARRKDLTFVCIVCAWRTAKSPDSLQG